eukprot:152129-Chlamydomonas_euryale.AAC.4
MHTSPLSAGMAGRLFASALPHGINAVQLRQSDFGWLLSVCANFMPHILDLVSLAAIPPKGARLAECCTRASKQESPKRSQTDPPTLILPNEFF